MEDLEWKLQLIESEVAHAYKEVDGLENGNSHDLGQARAKLERLLKDEAALAKAVVELNLERTERPS